MKLVLEIMDKSEFQCAELARVRMITAIITISFAEILRHNISQVMEFSTQNE